MAANIGIDLVGPLPKTLSGNKYIMTVTDFFSKWPEAKAIPTKEARNVAEFLYALFMRHGFCPYVISDQGREFCNQITDCLFELTVLRRVLESSSKWLTYNIINATQELL